ncbi:MAG TPA: efflux RND transporter periplasmic adaptor subunit [Isosphaeraceae bacterium]|nr:efflux RND transporter periplasmic adaptor subunit [Isosphaeraceae bacterium]
MVPMRRYRPRMRRWLALGVACASVTISGCSSRAGPERLPPPPVVSVVEARTMDVPIQASPIGTTDALQQVSIRARVRGFLKEQHFEEGAEVKAGQLLFVIDEEPFKAQLDANRAKLDEAKAALEAAKQSKAREVAQAQLDVNQAQRDFARVEERREQVLLKRNASTVEDVERRTTLRERAEAEVEAARASLEQARADYETNILAAQAQVEAAQAAVREAEIDLGYCRMFSPIDGRASEAKIKLGNLVGPSQGSQDYTELTTVQQLDPMGVDIQIASRYLDRAAELIQKGLPVRIARPGVEGDEDYPYAGKAYFIDNTINPTTSTFLIKARVDNPGRRLLPGEYVKVNVTVGEVAGAVVVPEQAVIETQAGPTVYALGKGDQVEVVPVKASFTYQGLRVIESGLEPGRAVIVEGVQLVRPGIKVKTERPPAKAASEPAKAPAVTDRP